MNTTTHAEEIDPLLAQSYQAKQEKLAINASDASDEAWSDPEKIKNVGVDELTAHRVAKQAMAGIAPETPGTTTEFTQIISKHQQEKIRALETEVITAAGESALPEGFEPRGLKIDPITREQFRAELYGGKLDTPKDAEVEPDRSEDVA